MAWIPEFIIDHSELNGNSQWQTQWTSATFIGKDFWSAEIVIPFAALACGDAMMPEWGLNLTSGLTCWAPTFGSFHRLDRFGKLTDLKLDGNEYRWSASVIPGEGTVGDVPLEIKLVNQTGKSRTVKLYADVQVNVESGKTLTFKKEAVKLQADQELAWEFRAPLTEYRPYKVKLTLTDASSGKVLVQSTEEIMGPRAFSVHWDRTFYMNEPEARLTLKCRLKGVREAVFKCRMTSPDRSKVIQEQTLTFDDGRNATAIFDLTKLPVGQYPLSIFVVKGMDDTIAMPAVEPLRKLSPRAGAVQCTEEGILLRDGEPFFPFGLYYVSRYLEGDFLKEYAQAGFNTFILDWRSASEYIKFAERVKPYGLVPLPTVKDSYAVSLIKGEGPEAQSQRVQAGRELIKQVAAGTDNYWGWYTVDEPPLAHLPLVQQYHAAVRELDPYHPSFYVTCMPHLFQPFAQASDIHAPDPYPGFPGGRIRKVSDYLDAVGAVVGPCQPVMAVLQTFYEEGGRMPSLEELRCMTYLSIVHGARGILYFSYDFRVGPMAQKNPQTWKALKGLAGEMRTLSPIFLSSEPAKGSIVTRNGRGVDTRLFVYKGEYYLLAVNAENYTVKTMAFDLKEIQLPSDTKIEVMMENRSLVVQKGGWVDDFEPYDVHLYRIGKPLK